MNRKTASGIMLTLLLIIMLTLAFSIQPVTASLPVHNIDTGEDFAAIQEAIDDSDTLDGHTIVVDAGTYDESIIVSKAISLVGEKQRSVITGPKGYNPIVLITASEVNIMGFSIQNPQGYPGIQLENVGNCTVSRNRVDVYPIGGYGIVLEGTTNSLIERNVVNDTFYGIIVKDSSLCTFSANTIADCTEEIWMIRSSDNKVIHNNFIDSYIWIELYDSYDNLWDDGYPSGGNYWSDYEDSYPDAEELDDSGIWDTPYVIDENNQDNYPLMKPWSPLPRTIDELKTEIEELYSEGEIDNQGIVRSLIAKLNVAQKLVDKGKIHEAKRILERAFIIQVQNLSNIHITPEAADILIQSAKHIISNL